MSEHGKPADDQVSADHAIVPPSQRASQSELQRVLENRLSEPHARHQILSFSADLIEVALAVHE